MDPSLGRPDSPERSQRRTRSAAQARIHISRKGRWVDRGAFTFTPRSLRSRVPPRAGPTPWSRPFSPSSQGRKAYYPTTEWFELESYPEESF